MANRDDLIAVPELKTDRFEIVRDLAQQWTDAAALFDEVLADARARADIPDQEWVGTAGAASRAVGSSLIGAFVQVPTAARVLADKLSGLAEEIRSSLMTQSTIRVNWRAENDRFTAAEDPSTASYTARIDDLRSQYRQAKHALNEAYAAAAAAVRRGVGPISDALSTLNKLNIDIANTKSSTPYSPDTWSAQTVAGFAALAATPAGLQILAANSDTLGVRDTVQAAVTAGTLPQGAFTYAGAPSLTNPEDGNRITSTGDKGVDTTSGGATTGAPNTSGTAGAPGASPPSGTSGTTAPSGTSGLAPSYTVQSGDSLWTIAERRLSEAGRPVDTATVDSYWRDLVEANRGSLASGNPSLIYSGETITFPDLPPISAPAATTATVTATPTAPAAPAPVPGVGTATTPPNGSQS